MSELRLYEYLRLNFLPDLEKSSNQFERFDCTSQSTKLHIELKCRRSHYDTLLIEKKKFDALISASSQLQFSPCYINSTPQGIFGFNLSKLEPTWQTELMPATTDFANTEKIEKVVGFLSVADSVHLSGAMDF
jgi:hypothetical protein